MKISDDEILNKALQLFSKNGYEAVSINDISSELGISKGALYKHFENKQDLFVKIKNEILEQTENQFKVFNEKAKNLSVLKDYILAFFDYWTKNEKAVQFRHLMILEQFRNAQINELYSELMNAQPGRYFVQVFETYKLERARELSFLLLSGINTLIAHTDSAGSDKKERDTLIALFEAYEKHFFNINESENENTVSRPHGLLQKASEINKN